MLTTDLIQGISPIDLRDEETGSAKTANSRYLWVLGIFPAAVSIMYSYREAN